MYNIDRSAANAELHIFPWQVDHSPAPAYPRCNQKCYRKFYERFSEYANVPIFAEVFFLIIFSLIISIAILILTTGFTCDRKEH